MLNHCSNLFQYMYSSHRPHCSVPVRVACRQIGCTCATSVTDLWAHLCYLPHMLQLRQPSHTLVTASRYTRVNGQNQAFQRCCTSCMQTRMKRVSHCNQYVRHKHVAVASCFIYAQAVQLQSGIWQCLQNNMQFKPCAYHLLRTDTCCKGTRLKCKDCRSTMSVTTTCT